MFRISQISSSPLRPLNPLDLSVRAQAVCVPARIVLVHVRALDVLVLVPMEGVDR